MDTYKDIDRHNEIPLDRSPETELHRPSHSNRERHSDKETTGLKQAHRDIMHPLIQAQEIAICSCTTM